MAGTVTIANNESLSSALDTGNVTSTSRLVGIFMPAAWTAANLTFQGSVDNSTFQNVYDDAGTEFTVTAADSRAIGLRNDQQQVLSAWRYIKIRSGTSGSAVNQGAARTLTVVVK